MASDQPQKEKESSQTTAKPPIRSVRIFSYPKVIFIWPTMVVSLFCGIGMLFLGEERPVANQPAEAQKAEAKADAEAEAQAGEAPQPVSRFSSARNILGLIFLIFFALNMLVMALDFPRFTLIAVILFITTVAFLMLYLASQGYDFLSPLNFLTRNIYIAANAGFYFGIAVILAIMFSVIWATRYLDYWEVRPNEVLHHHGPLSDMERYPTIHLKFDKEIPDILEFLLGLGSGRLVLYFGRGERHVVLDHVLFINQKENKLKNLMGQLQVNVMQQQGGG